MKLVELKTAVTKMQAGYQRMQELQKQQEESAQRIESEGRSADWTSNALRELRKRITNEMYTVASELKSLYDSIEGEREFYQDPSFVLSSLPITKSKATDPCVPENEYLEVTSRLSLMQEASLMNNLQLAKAVRHAVRNNEPAKAYLLNQVMLIRDPKSAGFEPHDMNSISSPARDTGLSLVSEGKRIFDATIIAVRESQENPNRIDIAVQKLAMAHEQMANK
jgi:hypothetical protein